MTQMVSTPLVSDDSPLSNEPLQERAATQTKTKSSDRLAFVEPIRAYAMSIVVFIHVASILAPHYKTISPTDWWIANMFHAFSKGGPPLFTLISGMLLLSVPQTQPIGVFFKKRFMKVLIPFLGWGVVYLAWRIYFNGEALSGNQLINAFVSGPVYYHLWFIQMILGLYFATPILRVYVQNASRANLRYFLIIWFVGTACLPMLERIFSIHVGIDLVVATEYAGYFVLGYYLKDVKLNLRQMFIVAFVVVGMMLATEYGTYALMMSQEQTFDSFFLNNLGFNMVVISVGLLLVLKSLPYEALFARFPTIQKVVLLLASSSLGIYFVHVLIMELLSSERLGFNLGPMTGSPLIGIPLTSIVVFLLSLLVIQLLKRVPLVNIFVP